MVTKSFGTTGGIVTHAQAQEEFWHRTGVTLGANLGLIVH